VKVDEILYFSPTYKYSDINWDDRDNLIKAFKDRLEGFYFKPAKELNRSEHSFAAGVICVTTIDSLARIETGSDLVGERYELWLKSNIKQFDEVNPDDLSQTLACRFYKEFRNGLVHEGRIKNAGQFSCCCDKLITLEQTVMIINPHHLLKSIKNSFSIYIEDLEKDVTKFEKFKRVLKQDFQKDVENVYK